MELNYKVMKMTSEQKKLLDDLQMKGHGYLTAYSLALRNYTEEKKLLHFTLLSHIDLASAFLKKALIEEQPICVVADYDVDGATSCSIMTKGLRMLGNEKKIQYFVPNRFIHGYGLQPSVVDDLLSKYPDTKVIVTVDNGIASIEGVEYAKNKGIEVVITDHHLEGEKRPENAVCIVNPNKKDCTFPSKALAGCGVAFYVIQAIKNEFEKINDYQKYDEQGIEIIEKAKNAKLTELLDYVAIGTIADLVSLDGNNRLLVSLGLSRIKKGQANLGVKALLKALDIEEVKFNTLDIAFKVAPVLNAAGRLEDMSKGIDLLLCQNENEAFGKALDLIETNNKRKAVEKEMKAKAMEDVEKAMQALNQKHNDVDLNDNQMFSFCSSDPSYHEGVIGILASRVKEYLYLPTIIFTPLEEEHEGRKLLKGSGRSIENIHLRDAIDYVYKKAPDCVFKFGGHSMAAGLTIFADKLDVFKEIFNEYCMNTLDGIKPAKMNYVDSNVNIVDVRIKDVEELNQQIWGQNFKEPIFVGQFKIISQDILKDAHLKLKLEQNGKQIEAMQFFHNKMYHPNQKLEAIYKFSINEYKGFKKLQIFIDQAQNLSDE